MCGLLTPVASLVAAELRFWGARLQQYRSRALELRLGSHGAHS